jgi:hypothetical protein
MSPSDLGAGDVGRETCALVVARAAGRIEQIRLAALVRLLALGAQGSPALDRARVPAAADRGGLRIHLGVEHLVAVVVLAPERDRETRALVDADLALLRGELAIELVVEPGRIAAIAAGQRIDPAQHLVERALQAGDADVVEALLRLAHRAVGLALGLGERQRRRQVALGAAHHDHAGPGMGLGPGEHVLGVGVAVDRQHVDAAHVAEGVGIGPLHQGIERGAGLVGADEVRDDLVIDGPAPQQLAERLDVHLDAIALDVDADADEQASRRDPAALIDWRIGLRVADLVDAVGAVADILPGRGFRRALERQPPPVVEKTCSAFGSPSTSNHLRAISAQS